MAKTSKKADTALLLETIYEAMFEKKAEHVVLLDMTKIKGATFDYFVICHGNSNTQVDAIAEEVRTKVKTICQLNPAHAEGFSNSEWILLDYLEVVVHVFQAEVREHFQLENLWADAKIEFIEDKPVKKTTKKNEPKPATKTPKPTTKTKSTKPAAKKTTKPKGKI